MAQLQASVDAEAKSLEGLASDPAFYDPQLDDYHRIQTMEAISPTFKSLPDGAKIQTYQNLTNQFSPQWQHAIPRQITKLGQQAANVGIAAAEKTAYPFAEQLKGGSLDYLHQPADALKADLQRRGQYGPELQAIGAIAPFAGATGTTLMGGALLNPLIPRAGMALNSVARAGIPGVGIAQKALQAMQFPAMNPILSHMLKGSAGVGAWEFLRSHPGQQMDLGARVQSGLGGAALGAALPLGLAGAGKVLRASAQAFSPPKIEFRLPSDVDDAIQPALAKLEELLHRSVKVALPENLPKPQVDALVKRVAQRFPKSDLGRLRQTINRFRRYTATGQGKPSKNELNIINVFIQKVERNLPHVEPPAPVEAPASPQAAEPLKGGVVETALQKLGLGHQEAITHLQELKANATAQKAEGVTEEQVKTLKAQAREIRGKVKGMPQNVRDVLATEHDLGTGVGKQTSLDDLLHLEDVADDLTPAELAKAEKLQAAIDKKVRVGVEHHAEITGTTKGKPVTITKGGNVKVARTDFSPLGFGKSDKGVFVKGYNESGHLRQYYLQETPEGSKISAVGVEKGPAFVGTHAPVGHAPGEYNIADILNRPDPNEAVKTSEALEAAAAYRDAVKPVMEAMKGLLDDPSTDKAMKRVIRKFLNGNIGRQSVTELKAALGRIQKLSQEDLDKFCALFGL